MAEWSDEYHLNHRSVISEVVTMLVCLRQDYSFYDINPMQPRHVHLMTDKNC